MTAHALAVLLSEVQQGVGSGEIKDAVVRLQILHLHMILGNEDGAVAGQQRGVTGRARKQARYGGCAEMHAGTRGQFTERSIRIHSGLLMWR